MTHHIIALHGAGMNAGIFGALASQLAASGFAGGFQALTLPGHRTDDEAAFLLHSIAEMAQWLLARIDAHPAASVLLVGHSMGALVALSAARHPKIVGIVAMGAAPTMPVNDSLLQMAAADSAAAQRLVVKWSCDPAHPQAETIRQLTADVMAAVPAAALGTDLAACHAVAELPPPAKPLLVISGRFDKMTPPERGAALAAMAAGGQVVLEAGHMMFLERAPETAAAIADFAAAL